MPFGFGVGLVGLLCCDCFVLLILVLIACWVCCVCFGSVRYAFLVVCLWVAC